MHIPDHQFSDIRLKCDIEDLANALAVVQQLSGKRYLWKDAQSNLQADAPHVSNGGMKTIGLIAQEVQRVMPSAVVTTKEGHVSSRMRFGLFSVSHLILFCSWLSVEYTALVPVLVEALKAQLETAQGLKQDVMRQLDQIGTQQAQVAASMADLRARLEKSGKSPRPPLATSGSGSRHPTKGFKESDGCRPAVFKAIVLGSLIAILLALALFLGLWFGWRPQALVGSPGSNNQAPSNSDNAAGNPGAQSGPNPSPKPSGSPSPGPSPSPSPSPTPNPAPSPPPPPTLPPPPVDPNAPVAPPTAAPKPPPTPPPAPTPPGVAPPGGWRNQNFLTNGGFEDPDAVNSNQPKAWSSSPQGVQWYDYQTNSSRKRDVQDLLFPALLNTTAFDLGRKGIRFTRTLQDRQNGVPVPYVTNAVPIRTILDNLAFLNGLSLSQLLSGLINGVNAGFWANWVYAPNNTNPYVNYPGVTSGTITLSLTKRVTILGINVNLELASVTVPMSLEAATGPAHLRTWASFDKNILFDLLALPDILDFKVTCDVIGDVFVDGAWMMIGT